MLSPAFLQAVRNLTCAVAASSLFLSVAACGRGGEAAGEELHLLLLLPRPLSQEPCKLPTDWLHSTKKG